MEFQRHVSFCSNFLAFYQIITVLQVKQPWTVDNAECDLSLFQELFDVSIFYVWSLILVISFLSKKKLNAGKCVKYCKIKILSLF